MIDLDGLGSDARDALERAARVARELGAPVVGTEHLLLGIIVGTSAAARALVASGATVAATRAKVAETAGGAGPSNDVDLDLSSRAARAVGRARRFSHGERSEEVAARHLLLGVLDVEGTAGQVLRGIGVDVAALRHALLQATDGDVADTEPPPETDAVAARCHGCGAAVDQVTFATVPAIADDGRTGDVVVFSCGACGTVLGITPRRTTA